MALPVIDFRLLVLMAEEAEPVQGEVPGTPVVTKAELEPPSDCCQEACNSYALGFHSQGTC